MYSKMIEFPWGGYCDPTRVAAVTVESEDNDASKVVVYAGVGDSCLQFESDKTDDEQARIWAEAIVKTIDEATGN